MTALWQTQAHIRTERERGERDTTAVRALQC
jgi:hypothetical protein